MSSTQRLEARIGSARAKATMAFRMAPGSLDSGLRTSWEAMTALVPKMAPRIVMGISLAGVLIPHVERSSSWKNCAPA